MAIFTSDEAKKNATGYWFGLAAPIVIGWGCSIGAMGVLMGHDGPVSEFSYVEYFAAVVWVGGGFVLWPLSAWWLFRRAKEQENSPGEKGSLMSLKVWGVLTAFAVLGEIYRILSGGP